MKLGNGSFLTTPRFTMSNLPSIESIDIGQECFGSYYNHYDGDWEGGASSFSLVGTYDGIV